ncbi:gamma-glutamyl-gamma-aminobutyrate hydrolase family protein, partial [Bradyrhizobium sp. 76]|nr:gamma-glutamyl-gamma-aminobutyrate hydrolase family protein [Bradyrhizobium sp. 76]
QSPCRPKRLLTIARNACSPSREITAHHQRNPHLGPERTSSWIEPVGQGHVARARQPMHGRSSYVTRRYHSLIVEHDELCAPHLTVTARSEEGEVMALAHRYQPTFGVQFHPDSILTEQGMFCLQTSCG